MTLEEYSRLRRDTHGRTRLYRIYENMLSRCYNPSKGKGYERYGGRGIRVCTEWLESFESFRDWALNHGYDEDLELDRIDNNGDYSPENCRFVSHKTNNRNRRNNHLLSYNGTSGCLAAWAEAFGIKPDTLRWRLNNGWSIERAFMEEVKAHVQRL